MAKQSQLVNVMDQIVYIGEKMTKASLGIPCGHKNTHKALSLFFAKINSVRVLYTLFIKSTNLEYGTTEHICAFRVGRPR